jgi:hypothetical protein
VCAGTSPRSSAYCGHAKSMRGRPSCACKLAELAAVGGIGLADQSSDFEARKSSKLAASMARYVAQSAEWAEAVAWLQCRQAQWPHEERREGGERISAPGE